MEDNQQNVPPPTTPEPPQTPPSAPAPEPTQHTPGGHKKADIGKRFVAALIDGVLAAVVTSVIPVIGGLVGAAYMVLRDGFEFDFMDRRSLGKKVMKLRPVRLDGKPMDLNMSAQRNWMFSLGAIAGALIYIPIIGWLLLPFVALAGLGFALYEGFLVINTDDGRRWGDKAANTMVVEVND